MSTAEPLRVADVLASVVSRGDRSRWASALVEECARSLDAVGVGLAVADADGLVAVAAATAGAGRTGEDLQFSLGEGPCRLAVSSRRLVHSPVLSGDGRWAQFAHDALEAGIESAFSVPLQVGAVLVGVLDVYRAATGPLSADSAGLLAVYGEAATAVLLLTDVEGAGGDAAELTDLADIRPVVHQAAGMVAVQLQLDLTAALLTLRAHAFGSGRPLRDLAQDVVARRLRFDHSPGGVHAPAVDSADDSTDTPDRDGTSVPDEGPDRPGLDERNA